MDEQLAATARQQAAAADVYSLEEQRYRAGIDAYLNLLVAQQQYYSVQQVLVRTKLTAAQNRVDVYQSLGGDSLLQTAPLCEVRYVSNGGNAALATSQCPTS
jgi:multidrug efflux system outer membrane protein